MAIFLAGISLLPIVLAGDLIQTVIMRQNRSDLAERFFFGWLLGSGVVTLLVFLFSYFNYQSALRWSIFVVMAAALGHGLWQLKHFIVNSNFREPIRFNRQRLAAAMLLIVGTAIFAVVSFSTQLGHDGLTIWGLMGKILFINGGRPPLEMMTRPFPWIHHLDYPWMIPTLEAWIYTFLGGVNEQAVKIIFILFFISLLFSFYLAVSVHFSKPLAAVFTLLLATTPYLGSIAAISGYVDVPLMSFLMAAFMFLQRWLAHGKGADLGMAAIMVSLAVWVKREGLIYWFVLCCLMAMYLVLQRKQTLRERLISAGGFVLPSIVVVGLWLLHLRLYDLPNTDFIEPTISNFANNFYRLPIIIGRLLRLWFGSIGSWGLTWFLLVITLVVQRSKFRNWLAVFLLIFMFLPPLLLTFSFVFSNWGDLFIAHMEVSIERLWLHVIPLVWYFIAVHNKGLDAWFRQMSLKPQD